MECHFFGWRKVKLALLSLPLAGRIAIEKGLPILGCLARKGANLKGFKMKYINAYDADDNLALIDLDDADNVFFNVDGEIYATIAGHDYWLFSITSRQVKILFNPRRH